MNKSQRDFVSRVHMALRDYDAVILPLMEDTRLCPFGGGRSGLRDSCQYGHPGCACDDWFAGLESGRAQAEGDDGDGD